MKTIEVPAEIREALAEHFWLNDLRPCPAIPEIGYPPPHPVDVADGEQANSWSDRIARSIADHGVITVYEGEFYPTGTEPRDSFLRFLVGELEHLSTLPAMREGDSEDMFPARLREQAQMMLFVADALDALTEATVA